MSENSDVFNIQDEIYLVFTKIANFLSFFYTFYRIPTEKGGAENAKTNIFSKLNNHGTKNIRHILTKNTHTHTLCFRPK